MATIDSVATTISNAITGANENVTNALTLLSGQLMATRVAGTPAGEMPALGTLTRSTTDAASFSAMELILSDLRSDLNAITEDVAAVTTIPAYGALETPIWSEVYWTGLKTVLTNMIGTVTNSTSMNTLIDQLTADSTRTISALYHGDLERKQQVLRDAFSAANAETGHAGFTYPNMMTTALQLNAQQQHAFSLAQTSRDIIKQIYEWAKSSYQFSVSKQVDVHAADVEFNLQYRRMAEAAFANEAQRVFNKYQREVELKLLAVEKAITAYRIAYEKLKYDDDLSLHLIDNQLKGYAINVQQAIADNQTAMNGTVSTYTASITAAKDALAAAATVATSSTNSVIGILNT